MMENLKINKDDFENDLSKFTRTVFEDKNLIIEVEDSSYVFGCKKETYYNIIIKGIYESEFEEFRDGIYTLKKDYQEYEAKDKILYGYFQLWSMGNLREYNGFNSWSRIKKVGNIWNK